MQFLGSIPVKFTFKQSVLNSAIRGKLVPQDPKDEPASKLLEKIKKEKEILIANKKLKNEKPLPPISEDEIPFELPNGWEWVRLGTIADTCLGKMLDKNKNKGNPQRYLRNINVRWFDFDLSDVLEMRFEPNEKERFTVKKGDLLICEGGEPGRCAVWKSEESIYFQKALHRVRPYGGISSDYISFNLWNDALSGTLKKYFTGTGIQHFVGAQLKNYVIAIPPLNEQKKIVEKVKEALVQVDSLSTLLNKNLNYADQLKQSILKKAFEGEL